MLGCTGILPAFDIVPLSATLRACSSPSLRPVSSGHREVNSDLATCCLLGACFGLSRCCVGCGGFVEVIHWRTAQRQRQRASEIEVWLSMHPHSDCIRHTCTASDNWQTAVHLEMPARLGHLTQVVTARSTCVVRWALLSAPSLCNGLVRRAGTSFVWRPVD